MTRSSFSWSGRLMAALLLLVGSTGLAAQTLVYEREFTLIGEADNTLRITLTPDNQATVERPGFMTRAGRFEAQAPEGTYGRLSSALDGVAQISRSIDQDIQQRAAEELVYVTDSEHTRFLVLSNQRQVLEAVQATSIQAWHDHFKDDIRLARLADLEQEWLDVMNQAMAGGAQ